MRTDDTGSATVNELYESSIPFLETYPDYDITTLPGWVRENIDTVRVYGHQNKGLILPDGRKYHLDNKLNDTTGKEWTFFINSVFSTHYPTSGKEAYAHHIRKVHPTPKPPQLMRDFIQFFSKEGDLIFDSFMGVGGTLLGAGLCGRMAAGIDLNQTYLDAYAAAAKELGLVKTRQEKKKNKNSFAKTVAVETNQNDEDNDIREKTIYIDSISIEEAIEQMELVGHDFYAFKDEMSGLTCVLYHRNKGYGILYLK